VALARTAMFSSAETQNAIESLHGIDRITVLVEKLDGDSINSGVTEDSLRTQVELELRRTGIKVAAIDGTPVYYLRLTTVVSSSGLRCYSLETSMLQNVTLVRNPSVVVINASTWSLQFTGLASLSIYPGEVRKNLSVLLDKFLNDYLSVNPK
jgi:hypothetical protein